MSTDTEQPTLVSLTAVIRCPCGEEHEFEDLAESPDAEWIATCDCGLRPAISPGAPIIQFAIEAGGGV